ncbi:MAG: glycogen/starch synthase [Treponema sp.]|nr:glycogen/starch synthase [Candidatus Treponema scatequi]
MKIWMIAREYAGIAEAGGVKNVVCSLSEELVNLQNDVTLFIPQYGCTDLSKVSDYVEFSKKVFQIETGKKSFEVSFSKGICNGVKIVFIKSEIYSEKHNVYTYCEKDFEKYPNAICGTGYDDMKYLNILFQKAICVYAESFAKEAGGLPEVVHCHDACTAALPAIAKVLFKDVFENTKFVVSIHNAGPCYHHEFANLEEAENFTGLSEEVLSYGLNGQRVEPYVFSSPYSKLSTVSYDYALELLDPNNPNTDGLAELFSSKKIHIEGITNGIDINRYLPENKNISGLPFEFSPSNLLLDGKYKCRNYFLENYAQKKNSNEILDIHGEKIKQYGYLDADTENKNIYISFHGRLVRQKGILIILDLIDMILETYPNVRFIINGQGENALQEMAKRKAKDFSGKVVYLRGYERSLARLCTASGDFSLFPSEFEPCGLEDFIAQIYGTIPVAHATGGLKKIISGKTGFVYSPNTAEKLFGLLSFLIENKSQDKSCYDDIIRLGAVSVSTNYTWKIVAKEKYLPYYR